MEDYFELALESAEGTESGIEVKERRISSRLTCLSFRADRDFGERDQRKKGNYHTLLTAESVIENPRLEREIGDAISELISSLTSRKKGRVLAVGLGNPAAVVDALGAEVMSHLKSGARGRGYLATVVPSVYGVTGLETATVIKGVAREFNPDWILCVDTLATRRAERLFRAVQVSNAGLTPGGGVGNRRLPVSAENLGVPVISVGVPLLAHADRCASLPAGLVVTPKEIDLLVPAFARALCRGVEGALGE